MFTIALGHLLARGVQLTTHEAVALAQELLGRASGIPLARNVLLAADGSASCLDEAGVPAVSDIAALLQELLPAGTPQVPAPLRYAIARGLQAVEAPPFATLAELSHALQRFEGGERRQVLRGLLQRVTRAPRPAPAAAVRGDVPVTASSTAPRPSAPTQAAREQAAPPQAAPARAAAAAVVPVPVVRGPLAPTPAAPAPAAPVQAAPAPAAPVQAAPVQQKMVLAAMPAIRVRRPVAEPAPARPSTPAPVIAALRPVPATREAAPLAASHAAAHASRPTPVSQSPIVARRAPVLIPAPSAHAPEIHVIAQPAAGVPTAAGDIHVTAKGPSAVSDIHVARVPSAARRIEVAPPLFGSVARDPRPVPASRRNQRLVAAAAVVASFAVGFAVMDRMSEPGDVSAAAPRTERARSLPPAPSPRAPRSETGKTPETQPAIDGNTGASTAAPSAPGAAPAATFPTPGERAESVPATPAASESRTPAPSTAAAGQEAAADQKPVATAGRVERVAAVSAKYPAAFSPAFASNGTAIFFHTGGARDSRSAIEMATPADTPGGDLGIMTVVDDGAKNYHAQPSPDGRFVAFDSDRDGERGIYVANRDGSQVHRVSGDGYAAAPTWSRDGEQLAYIRAESSNASVWNLWVQPAAGGAARRVTNHKYGQTWAASWFPDSHRICYTHDDKVYVLDLTSGQSRQFASPLKGSAVRTPAVSPDGGKIIFQVYRHGAWLLDLRDGSMECVLADPTAEEFAWAPDGRRVAFHSRRDGRWGIYVLSRG